MNYKNIYDQIIRKRKIEEPEGYTEVHHIVPRSLGGTDELENLVKLTSREHFICHYLLVKIYSKESIEWYKMNHAFMMMKCDSITQNRYYNSRLYESLRGNFSSIMSFAQSGKGNSQYGTMWICNIELKENRKIKKDNIIPDGWIKGRNVWTKEKKKIDLTNKLQKELDKKRKAAYYWYNKFIESDCSSIREFIRDSNYPHSLQNLINMFKKYVIEFNSTQGQSYKKFK